MIFSNTGLHYVSVKINHFLPPHCIEIIPSSGEKKKGKLNLRKLVSAIERNVCEFYSFRKIFSNCSKCSNHEIIFGTAHSVKRKSIFNIFLRSIQTHVELMCYLNYWVEIFFSNTMNMMEDEKTRTRTTV